MKDDGEDCNVTVSPWHNKVGKLDGVIKAAGLGFTITVCIGDTPTHPLLSVTVTEKIPELVTLIGLVVAKFGDQL